jgi:hypothetical protein
VIADHRREGYNIGGNINKPVVINMVKQILFAVFFGLLLLQIPACSSNHRSTTVVERSSSSSDPSMDAERSTTYEKSTTTSSNDEDESVLGATFDVIGDIISWPFRVVGALFRAIF